ncbi:MAG: cytochrome c-type biogenesis protein CcmH [Dehalococcoidia bacterium]|nr:cytochrome c-type biogenesis protein CcmH [Dehalococcoidia bacterium]
MVFLFAAALAAVLAACGSDAPVSLEEQAQSIDRTLICPVCPGETIDQAQVELARQMRTVVREKLAEGMTRDEVLRFFVERYGESVLAAPPKEGFNLIAWIVPIVAVLVGVVAVVLVVRAMRAGSLPLARAESRSEEGLEEYLAVVDMEIEGDQGARRPPGRQSGTGPGAANG